MYKYLEMLFFFFNVKAFLKRSIVYLAVMHSGLIWNDKLNLSSSEAGASGSVNRSQYNQGPWEEGAIQ